MGLHSFGRKGGKGGRASTASRLSCLCGFAAAFAYLAVVRTLLWTDKESCVDAFYHVRIAMEGWSAYAAKTFPTLTASSWEHCFADKELLFHALTGLVQRAALALGLPDFPFHAPSLFFLALLLIGFAFAMKAFRIEKAWLLLPLLVVIDYRFTGRILMMRPHVLSIALLLFSCWAFARTKTWRDAWIPAALGFLCAWSYSNPHFLLFPAGAFFLAYFPHDRRRSCAILGGAALGLLAGFVVHPQFPNDFLNWKIQCVDVPRLMFSSGDGTPPVGIGREALSRGISFWRYDFGLTGMVLLNAVLCVCAIMRKGRRFFLPSTNVLLILAFVSYGGFLIAARAMEYAVPFNLLLLGFLLTRERPCCSFCERRRGFSNAVLVVLLLATAVYSTQRAVQKKIETQPLRKLPAFLAEKIRLEPGTVVANLNWSDFPRLYYAAPQYRYLCGLDPTFGLAAKNPETIKYAERIRMGLQTPRPKEMFEKTGATLFYVAPRNSRLALRMHRNGFHIVFQDSKEGWLFVVFPEDLEEKTNAIPSASADALDHGGRDDSQANAADENSGGSASADSDESASKPE